MNIAQLKQEIINNPHFIEAILEAIPVYKIKDYGNEYRGARYEDSSSTGVCVIKETLKYFYRGRDGEMSGDIFMLVQDFKGIKFLEAVNFILQATGLSQEQFEKSEDNIILPFGGYFKGLKSDSSDNYEQIPTYPEDILDQYELMPSIRFQKDGINFKVQRDFKVGYDYFTDRISVPWRNPIGQIIGIMGRYNDDNFDKDEIAKWFPLKKFSKSQVLFGLYENYKSIQEKRIMIVGESEKFVMQLRSMETKIDLDEPIIHPNGFIQKHKYETYEFGVAVGSHSISNVQKKLIQSCFPDTVIIAFDEGIEEEYLVEVCKRLQLKNAFYQLNVGYIYDKDGLYLPKGSKASPTDFGKEVFDKLMCNCIKFI